MMCVLKRMAIGRLQNWVRRSTMQQKNSLRWKHSGATWSPMFLTIFVHRLQWLPGIAKSCGTFPGKTRRKMFKSSSMRPIDWQRWWTTCSTWVKCSPVHRSYRQAFSIWRRAYAIFWDDTINWRIMTSGLQRIVMWLSMQMNWKSLR